MKFPRSLATMALVLVTLAATSLHAQTTKYLLGTHGCSPWNGTYSCDGIPFSRLDGQPLNPSNAENGNPAFVWSNLLYNGQPNTFYFLTNDGLDIAGFPHSCATCRGSVVTLVDVPSEPAGVQLVTATLKSVDQSGNILYTGTLQFQYVRGAYHCGGGRGGGCVTPWSILGGVVTVTLGGTNAPTSDSPIAPTPVCLPGDANCPSRDLSH